MVFPASAGFPQILMIITHTVYLRKGHAQASVFTNEWLKVCQCVARASVSCIALLAGVFTTMPSLCVMSVAVCVISVQSFFIVVPVLFLCYSSCCFFDEEWTKITLQQRPTGGRQKAAPLRTCWNGDLTTPTGPEGTFHAQSGRENPHRKA